jgi:hypothetical protein
LQKLASEDADVMFADANSEDLELDVIDITDDINVDDSVSIFEWSAIKQESEDMCMEDSRLGVKKKGSWTMTLVLFY